MNNVGHFLPIFLAPLILYAIQRLGSSYMSKHKHWFLLIVTIFLIFLGGLFTPLTSVVNISGISTFYFFAIMGIYYTLSFQHGDKQIVQAHVLRLIALMMVLIGVFIQTQSRSALVVWLLVTLAIRFFRKYSHYDYWGSGIELLLVFLLNFNRSYSGEELKQAILLLFLIRLLLLIPNVFLSLSSINEIIIRQGVVLYLLSLYVKTFSFFTLSSTYFVILLSVSIALQIFSILSKKNITRTSLNALSFAPVLMLMTFSEQVIWVQSLYLLVSIYFLYVEVEGVALKSKEVLWLILFPQYFITFLVLPLPGSPMFFLLVDYLKMIQPSVFSLLIVFIWVLVLTLAIVVSVEGRINTENRSKYINPIKLVYLIIGMIGVILFVSDRFIFYKLINELTNYTVLSTMKFKLDGVGFRFFMVGIPLVSVFSVILFYSFRNHPYAKVVTEQIELFSYRKLSSVQSGEVFTRWAEMFSRTIKGIISAPLLFADLVVKIISYVIYVLRNFLYKLSFDLNRMPMSIQFLTVIVVTFIVFMVAYSYA